jgi:hypothetical protein
MAERVAVCLHGASSGYSRELIDTITSLADGPVEWLGDTGETAVGWALSKLDDSDRAALEKAIPAMRRLADAISATESQRADLRCLALPR